MDTLSIYYQNIRGMRSKCTDILSSIVTNNYDVICLCETWLDDSVSSSEFFDQRYVVYRRDRSLEFLKTYDKSHGGGVLIAVKRNLTSRHRPDWQTFVEDVWINIHLKNFTLMLCTAYLPSYLTFEHYLEFISNCERVLLSSSDRGLIIGDFNLPAND